MSKTMASIGADESSINGDLLKLSDDNTQTDSDLAKTRSDAAHGPGDNCYNASATVSYDAAQTVGYDVNQTFGYDLNQELVPHIASLRADIKALSEGVRVLASNSLTVPAGASAMITSARDVAGQTVSKANAAIEHANADLRAAYAVANGMATGSCAGDGPGSRPAPLGHIS